MDPFGSETDIIRMEIDALPEMEVEVEQRHIVPQDSSLTILRQLLNQGELGGIASWPVD
jgi:hypothetical protein